MRVKVRLYCHGLGRWVTGEGKHVMWTGEMAGGYEWSPSEALQVLDRHHDNCRAGPVEVRITGMTVEELRQLAVA